MVECETHCNDIFKNFIHILFHRLNSLEWCWLHSLVHTGNIGNYYKNPFSCCILLKYQQHWNGLDYAWQHINEPWTKKIHIANVKSVKCDKKQKDEVRMKRRTERDRRRGAAMARWGEGGGGVIGINWEINMRLLFIPCILNSFHVHSVLSYSEDVVFHCPRTSAENACSTR